MPLAIPEDIGKSYAIHGSGHEHIGKHITDPSDICSFAAWAGHSHLSEAELMRLMGDGGLATLRQVADDGRYGDVVAYMAADRSDKTHMKILDDLSPSDRLSRYLIGHLLAKTDRLVPQHGMIITPLPERISWRDTTYRSVGKHVVIAPNYEDHASFADDVTQLKNLIKTRRDTALLEVVGEECTIFQQGEVVADLFASDRRMHLTNTVFAAIELLNA